MLLANDRFGTRITDSALEEIGETTGNFRLTVWVQTWNIAVNLGLDNLGSAAIGPLEGYLTTILNSYFIPGDSLLLTGGTVPNQPDELAFGLVSYDAPVSSEGVRLGGTLWHSSVWPGNEQNTQTHIDSVVGELRGSVAAIEKKLGNAFDRGCRRRAIIERDNSGPLYDDQVRTVRIEASNTFVDPLSGHDYLDVVYRQGLPFLGASPAGDHLVSHNGASGTFSVINVFFSRLQAFNDTWSLRFATAAQLASAPLFYSQQFYLGGASFGRGFDAGKISGDNGAAASLELRFDQSVNMKPLLGYQAAEPEIIVFPNTSPETMPGTA